MSLLDKLIYELDDQYKHLPLYDSDLKEIKNSIQSLLNAKIEDCIIANDMGITKAIDFSLSSSEFCSTMAKEIYFIVSKYEPRITIKTIQYDTSLSPWQLSFLLFCFLNKTHESFNLEIIFKNNRYYEVV